MDYIDKSLSLSTLFPIELCLFDNFPYLVMYFFFINNLLLKCAITSIKHYLNIVIINNFMINKC